MRVICDAIAPVPVGGWAVLRVTSINDEDTQTAWPTRLHPDESTVSFVINGVRHRGVEQVDSVVETAALQPGQALSTGVLLGVSDRGEILPEPGDFELQVAISRPGTSHEVLSNMVVVSVTDLADTPDDGQRALLSELDAQAVALRDGETTVTTAMDSLFGAMSDDDRAWVATALLPPAPAISDPLLLAAHRMPGAGDESVTGLATCILEGTPYSYIGAAE